jgi:hypothetical protein
MKEYTLATFHGPTAEQLRSMVRIISMLCNPCLANFPISRGAEHKVNCGMPQENFGGSPWGPHQGPHPGPA